MCSTTPPSPVGAARPSRVRVVPTPGEVAHVPVTPGDVEQHEAGDVLVDRRLEIAAVRGDASNTGCALAPLLVVGDREAGG